ncbi:type II CRISPR RNA-guided endonuclease Cas9 [Fluviicola sp.]|jgi:CRISPR-associated endonuclease Csn1|uniref:type II CRISPR RNA-guided endonuclease Cas9 n=1 Tax=Fluviicola sp. TaxID=1917219 RepID=UPI00282FF422|nr:type II CRISPR RNA-guided endonuclease Cas9 [Fluviicola sp.]MDR0801802.1 type II CRISPR RNA-guided endonuclease Cas9 [Fluviicola sp.]
MNKPNKTILGLDLGTNSIGWALIENDFDTKQGKILGMGSRIIPMSQDILGNFDAGNSVSQTAARTGFRGTRRLYERHHQRRERLHRVLNVLGFLPEHYANQIDFEKRLGQFIEETEPKIAWKESWNEQKNKNDFEFIFQESFEKMITEFKQENPDLFHIKSNGEETKIPYDWTIYYLRKKALSQKLEKEELAWLILNFNQKRGYYQLRGEEEEKTNNIKEFVQPLKVISIEKEEIDKKNNTRTWYKITLENGWEYSATFTTEPNWLNTEKEFLVTEEYDDDGNIKIVKDKRTDTTGKEKRKITPLPSFDEINLMAKKDQDKIYKKIKARTEITISNTGKTVGTYIYETLLEKPNQKIRGKLVRTIEREFYKDELISILKKQIELQPEFFTEDLYNDCVRELYRNNEAQQLVLSKRDFIHLFVNDIIFYQRPLRSQKSSISNCTLEYKIHKVNKKDEKGNPIKNVFEKDAAGKDIEIKEYLKAAPKSNPLYQEFRVWQWLYNLKIYLRDEDKDVTTDFLKNVDDWVNLFDFLMAKKEVNHLDILKYLITPILKEKYPDAKATAFNKELSKEIAKYRWNYVFDNAQDKEEDKSKKYPCNETGYEIRRRLEKVEDIPTDFLTPEIEYQLWHIIYSVTDKNEFEKALKTFAAKHHLDENSFVESFKKFPPLKSEYGSFSEKAIKKLLPLIRLGKYWNWENIDEKIKDRISKILTGEYDETIKNRVREKAIHLTNESDFQGLQLWLAQYIVYDHHSEANIAGKWKTVADLEKYLKDFKQHSLRNPIVEQVITETLRVVRDIWKKYGNFSEIHIELGREMKNTAEERDRLSKLNNKNEDTNLRIKALIMELKESSDVENVRPYSPVQQEILKIYEDGVINSNIEISEDILKISKTAQPSKPELQRYKLWLEQKYRSPYTGQMIPLGKLFTKEYEIEHIIPQSRYFDDSLSNKVICEAAVNQLKDKQLGLEFIKNHHGEMVDLGLGKPPVKIFTEDEYKDFVKEHYAKNKGKRTKLLLEEIPDKMIERQMNDTRYISKFVSQLLSNIVREEKDDDGVNSKNLIPGNGKITTTLKQDWGLNDVWNALILPRFERMNELTNSENFTSKNQQGHTIPAIPPELSKGFQKKRIDHRHHAMDALVIAGATRSHVNYLNNVSAKVEDSKNEDKKKKQIEVRNQIKNTLCYKTKPDDKGNYKWVFTKPWDNFTVDARNELEKIVVSFKQNLRVINKTTNKYQAYENGKKVLKSQQKGDSWAIRKSLHKDTVSGKVELPWVKVPKGKILTATRKNLDTSFDLKTIGSITDTGIQKILKNYLQSKNNNPEQAFSPEGIENMNKNIKQFNNGKFHQPIYKVRIFELGNKFPLGQTGNKKDKYVEAAKGTNLFFAIYTDEKDNRSYETIPLNIVIERLKQGLKSVPEKNEKGHNLLFHLSPNDLVYVPTEDEKENIGAINWGNLSKEQLKRIYKFISCTGNEGHFVPLHYAKEIMKNEMGTNNKSQNALNGTQIKSVCIKLNIDRLGNIS